MTNSEKTVNLEKALTDPSSIFMNPNEVVINRTLSRDQKIEILKRWQSDIREIQVAEDENMLGPNILDILDQILTALLVLDAEIDLNHTPPTKQGG